MAKRAKPKITHETPIGDDVDLRSEDVRLPDGTRLTENSSTTSSTTSEARVDDRP